MTWLFDASPFLTRAHCGVWPPWLTAAYVAGNALTALAYFAIPAALLVHRAHRVRQVGPGTTPLKYQRILAWSAAFILCCGLTHVSDVLVFVWAPYRLYTALYLLTGLVSARVACMLPGLVRETWDTVPIESLAAALEDAQHRQTRAELAAAEAVVKYERIAREVRALEEIAWRDASTERLTRIRTILALIEATPP